MDKNVRKIAVVGDPATVLGFRGLGFETWPANPGEEVLTVLKKLVENDEYGIIYITNHLAEDAAPYLAEISRKTLPAVIPISMGPPAAALGQLALKDAVRRAVGFDILANKEEQ